jgi:cyclopropane-fatty-acyl-phospholipid synthase
MKTLIARRVVLAMLRQISVGRLTIREGGHRHVFGPGGSPSATVDVRSPAFWPMLARGGRGIAEAYREGLWDSPDIAAVFRLAARDVTKLDEIRRRIGFLRTPWLHLRSGYARNTPTRSRKDISAHYDLGNDLFSLMLDETMMYSCGVFEHRDSTLHEASLRKLEMVCEKLDLAAGDRVVEIGTGWGGFAVYAATTRGCHVTTTTISCEQHDLACARVRAAGVEDLVDVRLDDYRDLHGSYDKLVSLEMIEAVGHKDFGTFFAACSDLLAPHGTMLLQAITIDDRAYDIEKVSRSFIRTYVFPGGCLPSPAVIARSLARRTDMRAVHLEDLTHHYAETLRRWRANFDVAAPQLEALGYDERFRRLWRMYLAYCEAGFAERRIGLVQMVMAKPQHSTDRLGMARAEVARGAAVRSPRTVAAG